MNFIPKAIKILKKIVTYLERMLLIDGIIKKHTKSIVKAATITVEAVLLPIESN